MTARFNTLKFAESLESAGLAPDLTRTLTLLLHDDVLDEIATKQDLTELEQSLETKFAAIDRRFADVKSDLAQLELRLTVRMGAMLIAAVGVLVALGKLL